MSTVAEAVMKTAKGQAEEKARLDYFTGVALQSMLAKVYPPTQGGTTLEEVVTDAVECARFTIRKIDDK